VENCKSLIQEAQKVKFNFQRDKLTIKSYNIMYSWYKRTIENNNVHLIWEEETSLAGCNNGEVPRELRDIIKPNNTAPVGWVLPFATKWNNNEYSLVIDIKPKSSTEIFLCEIDTVFGFSYAEWSPVMLRLKILCSDTTENDLDKNNFIYQDQDPEIIYTMYYLQGSIKDGKLVGTWKPPFGTITGLLFWPEAMTFFHKQLESIDPYFLNAEIKIL